MNQMSNGKQENLDTLNLEFYKAKIEVLERENERLKEIIGARITSVTTSKKDDPNFDKPISQLNKKYHV